MMEENTKIPFDINFGKILEDEFSFSFETPESGIYLVEITASAKNKKQNIYPSWMWGVPLLPVQSVEGKGDDDDVYVKVDGREFPKLGDVGGLHNAPTAWSGASLKNTSKTCVFILFLEEGLHELTFHPEETPTLQRIRCEKLRTPQKFQYPFKYNNPPDTKDRSSWYTFAFVDLPLIQLGINAVVTKRRKWLFFSAESEFISPDEIGYISYSYPSERTPPKMESQEESIFWGVRWLYHKAQRLEEDNGELIKPYVRKWLGWRKAVWNYNANKRLVEDYVNEVFLIYEEGIDAEGNVLWEK